MNTASSEELAAEILEALRKKELETVKILIDGESKETLARIVNNIADDKMRQQLKALIAEDEAEIEKQKAADEIRKINATPMKEEQDSESDSSDVNQLAKQVKKNRRHVKLEQRFGYAYYGNVKSLMIAYGDLNPNEAAIKMMHSQIQTLKSCILKPIDEKMAKPAKIKRYLSFVFEQFQNFYNIKKIYKSVTQKAKIDDFQENEHDSANLPSDEEENDQPVDHMVISTKEEKQYFFMLTTHMNPTQYDKYSQCRIVNFLDSRKTAASSKKLMKFIDPDEKYSSQLFDLQLISFLFCRFVRKILFRIIRKRSGGKLTKLSTPVMMQEVKEIGNDVIDEYERLSYNFFTSPQQEAMNVFVNEFVAEKYWEIIPEKIHKDRKDQKGAAEIWAENKLYQKMWTDRLLSERQIEEDLEAFESGEKEPTNQYAKFVVKHNKVYEQMGRIYLWKKYFLRESVEVEASGPRKRIKLESLKR